MSSSTPLPSRRVKTKKRKSRPVLKFFMFIVFLCILGGAGYAGYVYYKLDTMLGNITASTTKKAQAHPVKTDKPVTILLLGVDSRERVRSLNSDVIMVASLNPQRKTATVVSIPRDTLIRPEGYRRGYKANAFYANLLASDKETANEEIKKIFGEYLKVPIDHLTLVNFQAVVDTVDAMDGLMIDVDMDMRYVDRADGTNINLKKGYQKLNGKQVLDYVRYRKSNRGTAGSNDFQRNARQQQVIAALVDKLHSFDGIRSVGKILEAVGDNVRTDLTEDQLKSLIWSYKGISNDKIEYIHLEGVWRSPYTYIDEEDLALAQNALQAQLR